MHHESDQRSKDSPGHGYPAYVEYFTTTETYVTKSFASWERAVSDLESDLVQRGKYVAFVAERPKITTTYKVELKKKEETDEN